MSAPGAREAADARLVAEAVQALLRLAGLQIERSAGRAAAERVIFDCGEGATSLAFSVRLESASVVAVGIEHRGAVRRSIAQCTVPLPAGALLAAAKHGAQR